jgi:hypothetical protein
MTRRGTDFGCHYSSRSLVDHCRDGNAIIEFDQEQSRRKNAISRPLRIGPAKSAFGFTM